MKILQVIPVFGLAGAETMCESLSLQLKNKNHQVHIVSLYSEETPITKRLNDNGLSVDYLNKSSGIDLKCIFKLRSIIKQFMPDVIHCHLYSLKYVVFANVGLKVRIVYTVHNIADRDGSKIDQMIAKWVIQRNLVTPVSLTPIIKESVVDLYKIDETKTPVILNGISLEKCKPISDYKGKAIQYLHVGRFTAQKNHIDLINGFVNAHDKVNDIELFLYGEGELEDKCKTLVKDLGASSYIHFCGTTNDIYSIMNKMDVFILPSLWEGMPMTLIEAMGTGMPIIASDVGGISNMIINGQNGLLIHPEVSEIENSVLTLYNNQALREKIGMNARKTSLKYSAKAMADKYLQIYDN